MSPNPDPLLNPNVRVVGAPADQENHESEVDTADLPPDEGDEELVFYKARKTKAIKVYDENGSSFTRYKLIEMMGKGIEEWLAYQANRAMQGKSSKPTIRDTDLKDFYAILISKCLYDESGTQHVPLSVIRGWPASTLSGLFEYCQTMNGLNDEGKEQAKKA